MRDRKRWFLEINSVNPIEINVEIPPKKELFDESWYQTKIIIRHIFDSGKEWIFWNTISGSQEKLATFKLTSYNRVGEVLEEWELFDTYVSTITSMELDETMSSPVDYELTIRYKKFEHKEYKEINFKPKIKCPKCDHEFVCGIGSIGV